MNEWKGAWVTMSRAYYSYCEFLLTLTTVPIIVNTIDSVTTIIIIAVVNFLFIMCY